MRIVFSNDMRLSISIDYSLLEDIAHAELRLSLDIEYIPVNNYSLNIDSE